MDATANGTARSDDERVTVAMQALATLTNGGKDRAYNATALADEIDRRTGVGFETATLVVLSSGY